MGRDNLQKLADYLLSGKLMARFNMRGYADGARLNNTMADGEGRENCGTVGCAIGYGPYAGITKNVHESWFTYSERVFDLCSEQWIFCFAVGWKQVDNSEHGAAKRILYLLKFGVPYSWNYDQSTVDEYTSKIEPFLPG